MSTTVASIIKRVQFQLMDDSGIRWIDEELIGYINDAQREICNYKPDAIVRNEDMDATGTTVNGVTTGALAPGTKQSLPASAIRLLSVIRNSYTGATRSVRPVSRETLDRFVPDWHSTASGKPAQEVKHFIFDEQDPKNFYVYPPQPSPATGKLEVMYTKHPDEIVAAQSIVNGALQDNYLEVADAYANAVIDYTLYRALGKDADVAESANRSMTYYQAFIQAITGKQAVDTGVSPRVAPVNIKPQ